MEILYFFEQNRTAFWDAFFSIMTYFGHELIFLVLALVMFWCIDKRLGYYLLAVGLSGVVLNQFLKMTFRIPRPWIRDPSFSIVESARQAATGYSFPSGHTQCAVGTFGCIAVWVKKKSIRVLALILMTLVAISRMYLGVHTVYDVGVSFVLAWLLVLAFHPLILRCREKPQLLTAAGIVIFVVCCANICFLALHTFPDDMNPEYYQDAWNNVWTLTGTSVGLLIVWIVDHRYLHFETKAPLRWQMFKTAFGLFLVLAAKALLKYPLKAILPIPYADALRYLLLVLCAGILWPFLYTHLITHYTKNE